MSPCGVWDALGPMRLCDVCDALGGKTGVRVFEPWLPVCDAGRLDLLNDDDLLVAVHRGR